MKELLHFFFETVIVVNLYNLKEPFFIQPGGMIHVKILIQVQNIQEGSLFGGQHIKVFKHQALRGAQYGSF
jgi:hypothetical protein